MSTEDAALLDKCFQLDTNIDVPPSNAHAHHSLSEWLHGETDALPGPVFVLKSIKLIQDQGIAWWPAFEKLQVAFRAAAWKVWPDRQHLLREPRSQAFLKRFFISVTEEEFSRGLLWLDEESQRQQTLTFRRAIENLAFYAAESVAKKFIDVNGCTVDVEAQQLLSEQLEMMPIHVSQVDYTLAWAPLGIDPNVPDHSAYLRRFLDDFTLKMIASLDSGAQKLAVKPDETVDEANHHLRFALVRARKCISTSAADNRVATVANNYLKPSFCEIGGSLNALIIYGRSGSGKTSLLSKILSDWLPTRASGEVIVIRFLGTTPLSSNVHSLLASICEQLRRAFGKSSVQHPVPLDYEGVKEYFKTAVTCWATASQRRLTLLLDSVDALDDSNAGRRLAWLPVIELPWNVRIVVSTLPDYPEEFQCLSILQSRLGDSGGKQVLEIGAIKKPEKMLSHLLRLRGRALTEVQRQHVMEAFERCESTAGTPLWLTIVAQAVSSWASFDGVRFDIKPSVRGLIADFFDRLVDSHGSRTCRALLAYITLSRDGMSESELNHLLALHDDALASIYQWWVPPVRIAPPLIVTRLLADLDP